MSRDYSTRLSNDELPDVTLNRRQRLFLRSWLESFVQKHNLNEHQLMYLAGAFEDAARKKRDTAS